MIIQFINKSLCYLIILILSIWVVLKCSSALVQRSNFANHQTESNLLHLKSGQHHDLLLMGISHARNFSRHGNHQRLEKILNSSIVNIGQGNGACGAREQLFYLEYFYSQDNHADQILYVLSPPIMFLQSLSLATNSFDNESFDLKFLYKYLQFSSENKTARIMSYLQSKLSIHWLLMKPNSKESEDQILDHIDYQEIEDGQDLAYGKTLSMEQFYKNVQTIKQTIELAKSHNSKLIFVIPPAVFGQWRGHNEVLEFGRELALDKNVSFYDFSNAILDTHYYYDHHHLNTTGVEFFAEKYLRSIITKE